MIISHLELKRMQKNTDYEQINENPHLLGDKLAERDGSMVDRDDVIVTMGILVC
jgi:hypothetical protein